MSSTNSTRATDDLIKTIDIVLCGRGTKFYLKTCLLPLDVESQAEELLFKLATSLNQTRVRSLSLGEDFGIKEMKQCVESEAPSLFATHLPGYQFGEAYPFDNLSTMFSCRDILAARFIKRLEERDETSQRDSSTGPDILVELEESFKESFFSGSSV